MGLYHQKASIPYLPLPTKDTDQIFPAGAATLNASRPSSSQSCASTSLNASFYIFNKYARGTPSPKSSESKRDPFSPLASLKPVAMQSSPARSPAAASYGSGSSTGTSSKGPLLATRKLCFVTVGATAPFDGLIDAVQAPAFLAALQAQGYTNLLLQHGHHDADFKGIAPSARQVGALRVSSFAFRADNLNAEMRAAKGDIKGLMDRVKAKAKADPSGPRVEGLDLGDQWQQAKWEDGVVISHAGSGSILDSLRVSAPLIVVPNEKLLDNHQIELAEELAKQGYVVHGHLNNLSASLAESEALRQSRRDWPPPVDRAVDPSGRGLVGIMDEEMGYVDIKGAATASVSTRPDGLHLD